MDVDQADPVVRVPGIVSLSPFPAAIYLHSWRGRFPHLMPVDVAIWNRYLDRYGAQFLGFQYDITLGHGATPLPEMSPADRFLLWSLTVKRADCLGIQLEGVTLYEVKPRLGMAAIGQVVSYYVLWLRQYGYVPAVKMAVVCEQDEPDLHYVIDALGFQVIVV